MLRICVLLGLSALGGLAYGQLPGMRLYTTQDGLSSMTSFSVTQDERGMIWVGTQDGLCSFDGHEFTAYFLDPADTANEASDFVHQVVPLEAGRLLVQTQASPTIFDTATETFLPLGARGREMRDSFFQQAKDGTVWEFSPGKRVSVYDGSMRRLSSYAVGGGEGIDARAVYRSAIRFIETEEGFWAMSSGGLLLFSRTDGMICYPLEAGGSLLASDDAQPNVVLFQSGERELTLVSDTQRLCKRFDIDAKTFEPLEIPVRFAHLFKGKIDCHYADSRGWVWVSMDPYGLFRFRKDLSFFERVKLSDQTRQARCLGIFEDRQGDMWFCQNGGVVRYDRSKEAFKGLVLGDSLRHSVRGGNVWNFFDDTVSNSLFLSTDGPPSMIRFRLKAGLANRAGDGSFFEKVEAVEVAERFETGPSYASLIDSRRDLWFSPRFGGLYRQNLDRPADRERFEYKPDGTGSYPSYISQHALELSDGRVLFCHRPGASVYDPADGSLSPLHVGLDTVPTIAAAVESPLGEAVWLATYSSGLIRVGLRDGSFRRYLAKDGAGICPNCSLQVWCLADSKGNVWFTTTEGLCKFDPRTETYDCFTEADGLLDSNCYAAYFDRKGYLWTMSFDAISRIDTASRAVVNFPASSLFPRLEFNQNSHHQNPYGELFFGGNGGMVLFDPDSVVADLTPPPVHLSDLQINYRNFRSEAGKLDAPSLWEARSLTLDYEDKAVSIGFSAFDYRSADYLDYEYRLEGFDDGWVASEDRQASYTSLPHGSYTLQMRAKSRLTGQYGPVSELRVVVKPPFWLTAWFLTLTTAGALGAFSLVVYNLSRVKLKRRLRDLETLQRIQRERESISRDLHDSVGSQLTYIISNLDFLAYKLEEETARQRVDKLSDFARGTISQLRETIWSLQQESLTGEAFLRRIKEYLQRYLEPTELEFEVIDRCRASFALKPGQVLNLFRIVQEAAQNAVKHAEAGRLTVTLEEGEGWLTLAIVDDGKGFAACEAEEGHYGLENMRRRAEHIGGSSQIESQPGQGVAVSVRVPLQASEGDG